MSTPKNWNPGEEFLSSYAERKMDEPCKESTAMELIGKQKELESAIRMYEKMFGTIVNGVYHEHCHSITYLKGRLDGLKEAMRVMDL